MLPRRVTCWGKVPEEEVAITISHRWGIKRLQSLESQESMEEVGEI